MSKVTRLVTAQYLDIVMATADLVVAVGPSNLLIEAALLGIPTVCIEGFEDDPEVVSTNKIGLPDAIERGLSVDFDYSGYISKYAHANDGKNTQRVLDLIKRIV